MIVWKNSFGYVTKLSKIHFVSLFIFPQCLATTAQEILSQKDVLRYLALRVKLNETLNDMYVRICDMCKKNLYDR